LSTAALLAVFNGEGQPRIIVSRRKGKEEKLKNLTTSFVSVAQN
jgi:hypothetical protein